jgi:hypothetical protein
MPRPLKAPTRDQIDEHLRDDYDKTVEYWKPLLASSFGEDTPIEQASAWVGALLWAPEFALNRAEISRMIKTTCDRGNTYSHVDREWVDMALSVHIKTNVVQHVHIPDAISVGIRPDAIRALYNHRDDLLTEDELLLTQYIRQVVDGTVDDETFDRMTERLGERGVVEYTMFITILWMTMRQFQALGQQDYTDEEMMALIDECEDNGSTMADGDWRARVPN